MPEQLKKTIRQTSDAELKAVGTESQPTFRPFDPQGPLRVYYRHLPHWRQPGATYFVTLRQADSIPKVVLAEWLDVRQRWYRAHGLDFEWLKNDPDRFAAEYEKILPGVRKAFERQQARFLHDELDRAFGSCVLRHPSPQQELAESLPHFHAARYWLGDFVIMDNHLHVLLRLNPPVAAKWSAEEVVGRWAKLFPPRDKTGKVLPVGALWIAARRDDAAWVAKARQRLGDLGWFMKCLKEPLAKMANREDGCSGVFFEGRFKSIAILDEASLLATCAYIDLNPVAAGKCAAPEKSEHTSVKSRVEHVKSKGRLAAVTSDSPYIGSRDHEHDHWLCPIEDRSRRGAKRVGMLEGLSLTGYLKLLDWSSRLLRSGKKAVSRASAPLLERLRIDADSWAATLQRFFSGEKLVGNFFGSVSRLQEAATAKGRQWLKDLGHRAPLTATSPPAG